MGIAVRMSFISAIRVALAALVVNKSRSLLTSLGIVIGVGAVIAMVSAGDGARRKLDQRLEGVGKNLILVKSGGRTEPDHFADFAPLTKEDAAAIRREVGHHLIGVSECQLSQRLVSSRTVTVPTTIVGCMSELKQVRGWQVTYGRFISAEDIQRAAPVCLLGNTVRHKLFPDKPNPVGERVRLDRIQFQVIGVTGAKGRSPTGADQDDQIFVPLPTLQRKVVGEERILLIVVLPVRKWSWKKPRPRLCACCGSGTIFARVKPMILTSAAYARCRSSRWC
jgi:putative ABC transport system permease protein